MSQNFSTEIKAWLKLLSIKKKAVLFFSVLMVLMTALFLALVWEYQVLGQQVAQFTDQVEVLVELDRDVSEEQRTSIQTELEELDMVKQVDYWSAEKSALYVDSQILPGYTSFLKKNQLDIPIKPIFRIQLLALDQKEELLDIINDRFEGRLFLIDTTLQRSSYTYVNQFIERLTSLSAVYKFLTVAQFILLMSVTVYFILFLLSERSRGFHLAQVLHLAPAYRFWPAFLGSSLMMFVLMFLGLFVASLVIGQALLMLSLLLYLAMVLVDVVVLLFGLYVHKVRV